MSPSGGVMMGITYSRKRYITVCVGCDGLFDCERKDQLCCDGTCRQRARRSGATDRIQEAADLFKVSAPLLQQALAIERLRPDLCSKIAAGTVTIDDVMPEVATAFDRVVLAMVR